MSKNNSKTQRALRRSQAEERQAERAKRPAEVQLALLDAGGHTSCKEYGRLVQEIDMLATLDSQK